MYLEEKSNLFNKFMFLKYGWFQTINNTHTIIICIFVKKEKGLEFSRAQNRMF